MRRTRRREEEDEYANDEENEDGGENEDGQFEKLAAVNGGHGDGEDHIEVDEDVANCEERAHNVDNESVSTVALASVIMCDTVCFFNISLFVC